MSDTSELNVQYQLDAEAVSKRLGLIVLDTDETTERDCHNMLPTDGELMFYTSRIKTVNPVTVENLKKHGPQLSNAVSLLLPDIQLDAIMYSCTSGTIAMGFEEVERQLNTGQHKVSVVTPITAAMAAFRALSIKSISMLTPYIDSVNKPMRKFIVENEVEVPYLNSFYVESDVDIARIPGDAIVAGAHECYREDTDALFISCTALRATDQIERLEAELGVPVLTSNQCAFWQAIRTSGYTKPVTGYGRLLTEVIVENLNPCLLYGLLHRF